jgi:NADPH:quinone reductase-like Zn-dependent oxidoreductase
MQAAIVDRYGPPEVAQVREMPTPTVREGHVLVRVMAAPVTSGDARLRAARFPKGFGVAGRLAVGVRGPRGGVFGAFFSGEVAAVGAGVEGFAIGDRVSGSTGVGMGAHADYLVAKPSRLVATPASVSPDAAAAILFGGTTALDYLRDKARLSAGATVLVNGASGSVGTAAVQIARHLGARVTALTSEANTDLVRRLGAERVIDYHSTSPAQLSREGERFDVVMDTVGTLSPASGRPLLAPNGLLLLVVASLGEMLLPRRWVKAGPAAESRELMATVLSLTADGLLDPVIEASVPLSRIAEAYARVDSGRKVGNIVVRPGA